MLLEVGGQWNRQWNRQRNRQRNRQWNRQWNRNRRTVDANVHRSRSPLISAIRLSLFMCCSIKSPNCRAARMSSWEENKWWEENSDKKNKGNICQKYKGFYFFLFLHSSSFFFILQCLTLRISFLRRATCLSMVSNFSIMVDIFCSLVFCTMVIRCTEPATACISSLAPFLKLKNSCSSPSNSCAKGKKRKRKREPKFFRQSAPQHPR